MHTPIHRFLEIFMVGRILDLPRRIAISSRTLSISSGNQSDPDLSFLWSRDYIKYIKAAVWSRFQPFLRICPRLALTLISLFLSMALSPACSSFSPSPRFSIFLSLFLFFSPSPFFPFPSSFDLSRTLRRPILHSRSSSISRTISIPCLLRCLTSFGSPGRKSQTHLLLRQRNLRHMIYHDCCNCHIRSLFSSTTPISKTI